MLLAWTTVGNRDDAERLAREAINARLAACVQIEGPIISHFQWETRQERNEEFRLCFKFVPEQEAALSQWVQRNHPYSIPEWVVVRASSVGEKYLSWAMANFTKPPF